MDKFQTLSDPSVSADPARARIVEIGADQGGQRIDNYLMAQLRGVPKSHIYRLLRSGQVRVNSGRKKPHYRLQPGDSVRIPPVRMTETATVVVPDSVLGQIRASIIHEDPDLLVLNKPAGLSVHAGSGVRYGVIEALRQLYPDPFLELVHRLDRDTSGCLMLARNRATLLHLHALLREPAESGLQKMYLALVQGHWPGQHTVDLPLIKTRRGGEHEVQASPEGARALSHFRSLQRFESCSLMQVQPGTGRTHQIRVHAAESGHAIAGDPKYGDPEFNRRMKQAGLKRLFLHAWRLVIALPGGVITVEAALPDDLQSVLDRLA